MGSLWSEDDVSFYLAFVVSTLKAESSPDAALDLSEIPGNLKELLDKNAIIVKLKSVQAAVNFLVSDAETQETINTALSEAVQPSKEDSNSAVHLKPIFATDFSQAWQPLSACLSHPLSGRFQAC